MGVVTTDSYAEDMTLHHQIHLDQPMPFTGARSFFVSMSRRGDHARAPEGYRAMNVSTHTPAEDWFLLNGSYDRVKQASQDFLLQAMRNKLPGFDAAELVTAFASTPVTWQNWVYRKKRSGWRYPPADAAVGTGLESGGDALPGPFYVRRHRLSRTGNSRSDLKRNQRIL